MEVPVHASKYRKKFEMEYIRHFYIVKKIGSLNISNNDITKLPFVFANDVGI